MGFAGVALSISLWAATTAIPFAAGTTASTVEPMLSMGACRVVAPVEMQLDCRVAAFGQYLPHIAELDNSGLTASAIVARVLALPEHERLACDPLSADEDTYCNAAVTVDRGGCAFQNKLRNVAAAGGVAMLLVNSEDSALMLGALAFEAIDAVAVSIPKSQGEQLRALLEKEASENALGLRVELGATTSAIEQAIERFQYFAAVNAPVTAFESYWDAVHALSLPTLEELVQSIEANTTVGRSDALAFFVTTSNLLSGWDFADEAALHAFAGAAVMLPQTTTFNVGHTLESAAHRLIAAGYYGAGCVLLDRRLTSAVKRGAKIKSSEISCQIALTRFLEADLIGSVGSTSSRCADVENKLSSAVPSIEVAEQTLHRLSVFEMSDSDRVCLLKAAGDLGQEDEDRCCYQESTKRGAALRFKSRFVSELYQTLSLMGVFMDELGAFDESLRFFEQADRLCYDGPSLKFRRSTAVPVVFDSEDAMQSFFYEELPRKLHALDEEADALAVVEHSVSALAESTLTTDTHFNSWRPEEAAYLQYTITPSTMLVGYQGFNVLPTQQTIYRLRSKLFPSLTSDFALPLLDSPSDSSALPTTRKRIGFISSWFRTHSVGKLLIGVIERLDRELFEVVIYRCVHFLRGGDDMTEEFKQTADTYVELPVDQESAISRLRNDQLDVAVFPELGMDAWTVLLSHHRVAPVQSVFWGHPITTGNPNIDFSISSQYFVTEGVEGISNGSVLGAKGKEDGQVQHFRVQQRAVDDARTSERIVLFRGLSTVFTKPKDLHKRRKHADTWSGITRSRLHLPESRGLYVCPQTLMKLNPRFDAVIDGILSRDPAALVVLLASDTQKVWTEQLRRRFRRRLGKHAHRVRFLPTLPYDEFMALLSLSDVILDPFPFGGGVTTLDALSLGIPVVTLPSAQTVVQLAAGFLRFMNATEGIVSSVDEYVSFAIEVASNSTKRQHIQATLLANRDAIYEDQSAVDDWNAFLAAACSL